MKPLILLLSLTICMAAGAQRISHDTLYIEPRYDTVRVVMLYTDTTKNEYVTFPPVAKWQFGYEVRERHAGTEGLIDPYFCGNCKYEDWFSHTAYLDDRRRPLPKSIIVWMAKQL